MYEESACFDPNTTMQEGSAKDGFSQNVPNYTPSFYMEDLSYRQNPPPEKPAATTVAVAVEHSLLFLGNCFSLYHVYNLGGSRTGSLFGGGGVDEREGSRVGVQTKSDRASIVGDAIEYIKELLREINELEILVEKKRCGRERSKRHKTEDGSAIRDVERFNIKPDPEQSYNGSTLTSSWLQRKSKDTEVDVSIIDDEVTIKLGQRKKINCLLLVSKSETQGNYQSYCRLHPQTIQTKGSSQKRALADQHTQPDHAQQIAQAHTDDPSHDSKQHLILTRLTGTPSAIQNQQYAPAVCISSKHKNKTTQPAIAKNADALAQDHTSRLISCKAPIQKDYTHRANEQGSKEAQASAE
ncbi:Transcription factor bHLH10 [Camellia lanceoleosa]|uniref:Transcription factor bHLH10 n=1 Tax=Camellia lanceoleosa TaxID=1840588 RepID=A0ACC0II39_9ERIC|nr:Transcription factor bHLH10 [Camellia lanceoleosa]